MAASVADAWRRVRALAERRSAGGPWRSAPAARASARLRIDRSTFGPTMGPKVEGLGRILAAWRPEVGPRRSSTGPRPDPFTEPSAKRRAGTPAGGVPLGRRGRAGRRRTARRGGGGPAPPRAFGSIVRPFGPTMGPKVEGLGRILAAWRPEVGPRRGSTRPRDPDPLTEPSAKRRHLDGEGAGRPRRGTPPARDAPGTGRRRRGTPTARDAQNSKNRRRQPRARRAPRVQHREHRAQQRRRAGVADLGAHAAASSTTGDEHPGDEDGRREQPGAGRRAVAAAGERGLVERAGAQVEAHAERDDREADAPVVEASEPNTMSITAGPISSRPTATAPAKPAIARIVDPDRAAEGVARPRSPRARTGAAAARSARSGRAAAARA